MNKDDFGEAINDLWAQTKTGKLPRDERFKAVEKLTDEYIASTGERPEPEALDRLATLCLFEEVTDATPWKTKNTEYPVHSPRQQEEIEKNEANCAPPPAGRKPTRRKRSDFENTVVNKTKTRNEERRKAYRDFTKVQPVRHWNMYTGEIYD